MTIKALARNTLIGFIILAVVYFICYNWLDISLMYMIYAACTHTFLMQISHILSLIFAPEVWMLVAVIAAGYGYFGREKLSAAWSEKLLRFGLTLIATGIVLSILKVVIGRYRPEMLMMQGLYGFNPLILMNDACHSSPSGHATMAFCGFYTLAGLLKKSWLTPFLLLCAVIISLAKLVLADHYLSDILFGGYLGIICSLWMEVVLTRLKAKWCPHVKAG